MFLIDYCLDQIKDNVKSLLSISNTSNNSDWNNNNSVDDFNEISLVTVGQENPCEVLTSSLTRLIAKLQDNSLSEDDFINTLEELAELEVTVPALLETGAGIVVRRLEKMKEHNLHLCIGNWYTEFLFIIS